MERVYKTFTGGYSREKDGKEATHVILSVEEYNKLTRDLRDAQNDKRRAEEKAERDISDYKAEANNLIIKEREANQKILEALERDLKGTRLEINRLNDLNANLSRIMRERANAKRGLKPKKEHNGYLVIDSQQYNYNFHYLIQRRSINYALPCWKVKIQTPYDSSIPFSTIKTDIEKDFLNLFKSLGLNRYFQNGLLESKSKDFIDKLWNEDFNFVFRVTYKSNYKTGLWEIELLVRASLTVPENMRII